MGDHVISNRSKAIIFEPGENGEVWPGLAGFRLASDSSFTDDCKHMF
jgi:hypothetical protein